MPGAYVRDRTIKCKEAITVKARGVVFGMGHIVGLRSGG